MKIEKQLEEIFKELNDRVKKKLEQAYNDGWQDRDTNIHLHKFDIKNYEN
jgi:hypothetical protein